MPRMPPRSVVLRVAAGPHQVGRLLGRVHHGHQKGLRADVQVLLDQRGLAHRHPRDGVGARVGGNRLQLRQDVGQAVGCMLAVDQQPVEAGARADFGAVGVGQAEPQADLGLALGEGVLEGVGGGLHGGP
jgi:hypothetical protein